MPARVLCVALLVLTAGMAKLLVDVPRLRYNLPTGSSAALEYLSELWGRDVSSWLPTFIRPEPGDYVWVGTTIALLVAVWAGLGRVAPKRI